MHHLLKKSTAFVLFVTLVACAATNSAVDLAPASLPSMTDIVPIDHNGRIGVWFEEKALGDVLAGIEREKGKFRLAAEQEKLARELAEQRTQQIEAANQPGMLWVKYGLTTGLGALLGGLAIGFVLGRR